ncbi:hypothetical protein NDU88_007664 [Pleurodeles waltl]|uniref:Uncharacterized protein n=1 Tax=Pleurodeles waltl TaxID=8319 RepID=A0AAV7U253_PLEWA|nr:hypothetical protein NDU88_007664 [Pleurodeles waltl]
MSSDSESDAEEAAMAPSCAGSASGGLVPKETKKPAGKEHVSWLSRKRKGPEGVLSPFQKLFSQKAGVTQTKPSSRKEAQAGTSNKPPKVAKLSRTSFLPSDPSESSGADEEDSSTPGKRLHQSLDVKEGDDSVAESETQGEEMFNPDSLTHRPGRGLRARPYRGRRRAGNFEGFDPGKSS